MAKKVRITSKTGNARRNPRRARVNVDQKGAKRPPLPRGFKVSQCYFDNYLGRWVLSSSAHRPVTSQEVTEQEPGSHEDRQAA